MHSGKKLQQLVTNKTQPEPVVKARSRPSDDGRFIWLSSLAAERIVNELGQTQAAFGMAVYVALCRLSSREKNNPEICATVAKIAGLARLGYRKTFDILSALETTARVIRITPGERAPSDATQPPNTYTLLACRLHNTQSGRLHNTQSADCLIRSHRLHATAPSHAETPKETPVRGLDKKQGDASQQDQRLSVESTLALPLGAASGVDSGTERPSGPPKWKGTF
jgi:hypothetical protein